MLALASAGGCRGGGDQTNGLEKKPASEVHQEAVATLKDAKNVHVTGTTTNHSQNEPARLDLRLQNGISGGAASLKGSNFEITTAGEDFYLKGDQSAWQALQAPPAVEGAAGGWAKLRASQVKLDAFSVAYFATALAATAWGMAKVEQATLDGAKVVVLSQPNGSRLYVANTGPAYPVRIDDKSSGAQLDFTQYGVDFQLAAPTDIISNALTATESVWLDAVGKLLDTMNAVFDNIPTNLTTSALKTTRDNLGACSRELARIGLPSERLQPVHSLVKNACTQYDEGAQCFATAASIGLPLTEGAKEKGSTRRLTAALPPQRRSKSWLMRLPKATRSSHRLAESGLRQLGHRTLIITATPTRPPHRRRHGHRLPHVHHRTPRHRQGRGHRRVPGRRSGVGRVRPLHVQRDLRTARVAAADDPGPARRPLRRPPARRAEPDSRQLRAFSRVKILGCGSAYYVGQIGATMIEELARMPADAEAASEFRYRNPIIESDTLYVVVSQSGEIADTLFAVESPVRNGHKAEDIPTKTSSRS